MIIKDIKILLKSEDMALDRVICTLEKIEDILILQRNYKGEPMMHTVVGSYRELHDDSKNSPTSERFLMELLLQCCCLDCVTDYDEVYVFNTAVSVFMKDILEWYAGRELLEYYDEVDASVIPIMLVLRHQTSMSQLREIFQKYIHSIPTIEQLRDEKFQIIKTEVEEWIYRRWTRMPTLFPSIKEDFITSHRRGNAVAGYKRVLSALIILFDTSTPAKMLYSMVNHYLPQVAQHVSHFNEEAIERAYEMRASIK